MKIEKANRIGFCLGVRRAIDILERVARERQGVETLGAVVHNQQVLQRLADLGVKVVRNPDNLQGDTVVISAHGANPQIVEELQSRKVKIIDATCPFVHRAQIAARRLANAEFAVIIYGDAEHPEVKGILGWAKDKGIATLDDRFITKFNRLPQRIGVLSQTTQIPAHFTEFVKKLIDSAFTKDCELRIIDTICHDTRERQESTLKLASQVDLMLVIGDHTSANTNHLVELCAKVSKARLVESAAEIQPSWLKGHNYIGVTAGASTSGETIEEILSQLEAITHI